MSDNKQFVLTRDEIKELIGNSVFRDYHAARRVEQAVLFKLRGAGEPIYQEATTDELGEEVWFDITAEQAIKDAKLFRVRTLYAAPQASTEAAPLSQYGYQALFDAISAATRTVEGVWIEVSVQAFRDALKSAPAAEGEDFPSDLPGQLREYASNNGYSHQDYADTMRQAADALDRQQRGGDADELKVRNDGYSDGIITALQLMTSYGDYGSTMYCELLKTAGMDMVIERAISEYMWELAGLDRTQVAVERRATLCTQQGKEAA